jgi:hypothetical protein
MDDMQDDERRAPVIAQLIRSAEDYRRANRYPEDHPMLSVLPDWFDGQLSGQDREDLLVKHHLTVRSHTEVYGGSER